MLYLSANQVYADSILTNSSYDIGEEYSSSLEEFNSYQWSPKNKLKIISNNPITKGSIGRPKRGSSYWTTSSIREWLNSSQSKVDYTCNPPSSEYMGGSQYAYDNEAGFLSNFTEAERNAIAITERRVWVQDMDSIARDGGSGTTGHANVYGPGVLANYSWIAFDYKKYGYKIEKDKVFLLTPYECYWYLSRRGFTYSRPLTNAAKVKNNTNSTNVNWWLCGGTKWQEWDKVYFGNVSNDMISYADPNNWYGVVPAINIKPSYVFDDGRKASSLKIGDKVSFGTYLNEKIQWQVINISDTGYPMLLAINALDLKKFDAIGDQSKVYSEYINFGTPDVSLVDDVQYKTTKGIDDYVLPVVTIKNADELNIRQNGSFTLDIEVEDADSGIDYIIKPDGTKTTETSFQYTATKNGKFTVKVMDKAGNFLVFVIPVSNINESPVVEVRQSTTDWTNKDVQVDVTTSNDVQYTYNRNMSNMGEIGGAAFPNYISYVGKEFRVTGKAKLVYYNQDAIDNNANLDIGFSYKTRDKNQYTYTLGGKWTTVKSIPISDLIKNGEMDIDFTWTIPSNYVEDLKMWCRLGPAQAYGYSAEIEFVDLKYSLIDDTDFAITEITLPDGTHYKNKIFTGFISDEGINSYTYKVLDNRNKTTSKTITTKIDKTNPKIEVAKLASSDTNKHNYTVTFSDTLSGLKSISYPGKTETLNSVISKTVNFSVSENGQYDITATDLAGNKHTVTIDVSDIDKTYPNAANINLSREGWGKDNVTFNITMPHKKNVKIAVIEDVNNYKKMSNKLKRMGYTVDMLLNETNFDKLKGYDVVIAEAYCWSVSKGELLKKLYDAGVSILTTGNDNNNSKLYPIKSTYSTTGLSAKVITNKVNEFSYMLNGMPILADSNTVYIVSTVDEAEHIAYSSVETSAPSILKIQNGNNGEWVHIQDLINYWDDNHKSNEFIMGIIDDLIDYNDDTGISNIEYKIDEGDWIEYRGETFEISNEGYHTIYARVTDNSGKQIVSQKSIGIDRTVPTATFKGDLVTYDTSVELKVSNIDGTISKAVSVDFSEDSTFKTNVITTKINNETIINKSFILETKTPASSNYGDRIIYARVTDQAGNQTIYSHTVAYKPGPPQKPTFILPNNNSLFIESEPISVKWTYKDNNGFEHMKSVLKVYDKNDTLMFEFSYEKNVFNAILNLPKGEYYIVVENYNSFGESSVSDKIMIRVNSFLNKGSVFSKTIDASQKFNRLLVLSDVKVPQGCSVEGRIYYSFNLSGAVNTNKYITFDINKNIIDAQVINLPESTNKIVVQFIMERSVNSYISPELDSITIYAR